MTHYNGAARLIRRINRSAILELLREGRPLSRSEIARKLSLSLPTVMRIVDELTAEQLIQDGGVSATRGRPSQLVEFNGNAFGVVGVDLGGTKMSGMVADIAGNIQHTLYRTHQSTKTELNGDYLEGLTQFIQELLDAPRPNGQRIRGIGIGAPGVTLAPEGIVTWAPSLGWRDLPLQQILTERFQLPVIVENDVNLAALGEWGFGVGKKCQNMITIAIGTGIGAGIIINGEIYRGHNQAAGEVGYMLPSVAFLGKQYEQFGALESLASGTGIVDRARQLVGGDNGAKLNSLTTREVFQLAEAGVPWAVQVVDETVDYLTLAIANISAILDPELVILGGGVTGSAGMLLQPITEKLKGLIPMPPRIAISTLGRHAAVMGAITQVINTTDERMVVKRLT